MKKLDRLGNSVFNAPPSGIIADQQLRRHIKVIGDQKGWLFPAVATDNDLPYFAVITAEFSPRFVNHRLRILTLIVGDGNPSPGFKVFRLGDELMAPSPEGDEPDLLAVEFGEMLVGGQFGIEDAGRFHRLFDALPEGQEGENLLIGLAALDIRGGKKKKPTVGILCQERQCAFHPSPPGAGPVFLEN